MRPRVKRIAGENMFSFANLFAILPSRRGVRVGGLLLGTSILYGKLSPRLLQTSAE